MNNTNQHQTSSVPRKVTSLVHILLKDEAISGKLLIIMTILALITVNSPLQVLYGSFWNLHLTLGVGSFSVSETLLHWVNDGLMAIFFLVVGLEIKREVTRGELRRPAAALLPVVAAIGGMIVPALIYVLFNVGTDSIGGWGIPVATDIAFAIGVLALLGRRAPASLRVFLLTLAIVDDLLAIIIIALFYTATIEVTSLLLAGFITLALFYVSRMGKPRLWLYGILGIVLWLLVKDSGVHPTIAGAIVGLLAPLKASADTSSIAERLERMMIPISTFIVIPLFAFANAGLRFADIQLSDTTTPIMLGIGLGLIAGKVTGIVGAVAILTKLKLARLPARTGWQDIVGVGMLAGIGFTVSIFITELAFAGNSEYISSAKTAIFVASLGAATAGGVILATAKRQH